MSSYNKRLYRSNSRILGGVCSGIAEYFGIDSALVRIAWVALSMMWGSGILIYLLAWLLIPPSPYLESVAAGSQGAAPTSQTAPVSSNTGLIVIAIVGAIILIAGLANLMQGLFSIPFSSYVMPIALVIIGMAIILIAFMRRR